jgi:hypothetical protein
MQTHHTAVTRTTMTYMHSRPCHVKRHPGGNGETALPACVCGESVCFAQGTDAKLATRGLGMSTCLRVASPAGFPLAG